MDLIDKLLKIGVAPGYLPSEFEAKIVAVGGRIFPYVGTVNPASGWVFSENQDDFINIIAFDCIDGGTRMVQKSGKIYYYLAKNGASFRCTLP